MKKWALALVMMGMNGCFAASRAVNSAQCERLKILGEVFLQVTQDNLPHDTREWMSFIRVVNCKTGEYQDYRWYEYSPFRLLKFSEKSYSVTFYKAKRRNIPSECFKVNNQSCFSQKRCELL